MIIATFHDQSVFPSCSPIQAWEGTWSQYSNAVAQHNLKSVVETFCLSIRIWIKTWPESQLRFQSVEQRHPELRTEFWITIRGNDLGKSMYLEDSLNEKLSNCFSGMK